MTQLDVLYTYAAPPSEAATHAISKLREVYGVRRLEFNEAAKTIRIEYDATRLNEPVIRQLLRRAGLDIVTALPLSTTPPPPPPPAPAPTA